METTPPLKRGRELDEAFFRALGYEQRLRWDGYTFAKGNHWIEHCVHPSLNGEGLTFVLQEMLKRDHTFTIGAVTTGPTTIYVVKSRLITLAGEFLPETVTRVALALLQELSIV